MSYILDALKKAESERERGVVPGLGAAQTSQSAYIRYGAGHTPVWLGVLALGALLAAAAALWGWRQAVQQAPAEPLPALATSPVLPATPQLPQAAPEPVPLAASKPVSPVAQGLPQAATQAAAPLPVASVARSTVAPIAKVATAAPGPLTPLPAMPAPAAPAAPAEAATKAPPAAAAQARMPSSSVLPLSELPESVRRQIPALAISGAIYSDAPPEWTLIINDQVLGKGSQVAPDLRLEEISASSAVFNFKGQRFRVDR